MSILKKGSRNKEVQRLQAILSDLEYNVEVDGIFGAKTEQVVRTFQKDYGLNPDGIVGQATWGKLEALEQNQTEGCSG